MSTSPPRASSSPLALAAIVTLAALVRLPFLAIALRAPVDGDTGIVGLMALQRSTAATFWGQAYGSPLDAWLAVPFVALLGPTSLAVRLPYFLLSLALVPLVHAIARRVEPAAALPAAFLMACPPSYFVLLSALPPPFYPTTLVLLAALLLGTLRLAARGRAGWEALVWGALAGLALWTHLMSAGLLLPCAVYLWTRGRGARLALLQALLAAAATSAPVWLGAFRDGGAASVVSVAEAGAQPWRHAQALLPQMHRPLLALLGARCPLTADDPQAEVALRWLGTSIVVLLYLTTLVATAYTARRRGEAGLLLACVLLPIAVFPFPLRSGPETVRFLTPAFLPLSVLAAWAAVDMGRARRAWTVALSLAVWHLLLTSQLLAEWRRPQTVLVPDCRPALTLLQERGLTRAWASYNTAYCLTYTSGQRVVASQPWNERFPGMPLPYLDELRFSTGAAWVLMPGADFDLPSPERLAAWIAKDGGRARRTEVAGGAVVFDEFVAPFSVRARPWPAAGAAGDGDLGTRVVEPPRGAVRFELQPPAELGAVTLLASPAGAPDLPAGFILEVSHDGREFERVAHLRPSHRELAWANGQPQPRAGAGLVSIPLAGRRLAALRLTPAPAQGPWALAELLLHPRAEILDGPLPQAPAGTWAERRAALQREPHPDRVDWLLQLSVAGKQR